MAKKPSKNPIVISGKSVATLSLLVEKIGDKELFKDESGRVYSEPPEVIFLADAKFKLQEEEEATPGLPGWWWHYHRVE